MCVVIVQEDIGGIGVLVCVALFVHVVQFQMLSGALHQCL